ncbi:MAG TPA: pyridoxal phosphate-dependent aminotransferase [Ferrovibrio sp.]|uniref:pyridoxal phosphate-dependent aminotransferase n=1 Tax=Ferrovibrio sp. TaxID=1917215 RepID=UPI002ED616C3
MPPRSRRLAGLGVSPILQMAAKAAGQREQGRRVISLSAGEPDGDTPDHIKAAAMDALRAGATRYTPLTGTPELRRAIAETLRRSHDCDYRLDEIIVSAGAKQCIFNALMATLDPGDEVILAAPYWTSYIDIVRLCGGVPVVLPGEEANGFKLTAAALAAAIGERTRWVILNSPANPTGAVHDEAECRALLAVLRQHHRVWILSDEIYAPMVFDGRTAVPPAALMPELRPRILTVNGVSKAYAMTGWRIGYAAGAAALIAMMAVVQSQSTSCACSISQAAATAALTGPQDTVAAMRASLQQRRDLTLRALAQIPGLRCPKPQGAFYAFVGCADLLAAQADRAGPDSGIADDVWFCEQLLAQQGVAAVPGSAFGMPGYFRLSYATAPADLAEALQRLERFCAEIARAGRRRAGA